MDTDFICAFCFQPNSIFADPSGGSSQQYVEDCQICCQPNWLTLNWSDDLNTFVVESQPS